MEAPHDAARLRSTRTYGRAAENATLASALDQAASGRRAIVLIDGEAGIGKTRVLAEATNAARTRGMRVAAAEAIEWEQARPFGLMTAALGCIRGSDDPRCAAIAELLATNAESGAGAITVSSDPGLQFRVVDAMTDLVEELALAGPLALILDDMQWADPSSLVTLSAIIRRVAYLPVALIGSRRPLPSGPETDRFLATLEGATPRLLTVGALDDQAARELAAEVIAAEPSPWMLKQLGGAAGNPLFIKELVCALLEEDDRLDDGGTDGDHSDLPPTLRVTILRRLSFLPEPILATLRCASILGSHFTVTQLAATASKPVPDLMTTLNDAMTAGVLEAEGARLRFRHDLIREAIYQDMPTAVRNALHREAGARLAATNGPVQQVAAQFSQGADRGDAEAIEWLTRAARESVSTSPLIAADLFGRATDLMTPDDVRGDQWIVERARALVWAGRMSQAAESCEDLLVRAHDPRVEGSARLVLGNALLGAGHVRRALHELGRAVEAPLLTEDERATVLSGMSVCHIWLVDLDAATDTAGRAKAAARAVGNHMVIATATTMAGVVARLRGELARSLEICDEAVRLADESPGREGHRYPVHAPRGYVLVEFDRYSAARATLDAGMQISAQLGNPWHLANYQMVRASERYICGEWDDAVAEIEASIELARETGEAYGLVICRSLQAMIDLHRNDLAHANEAAAQAVRLADRSEARYDALRARRARALVWDAQGRSAEAYDALADVWEQCTRSADTMEYRVLGADLVRMALAAGDRRYAHRVADAVARLAERNELPSLSAAAMHCEGLVREDPEVIAAAAALYAPGTRPLDQALTYEAAGTAFIRRGDPDRAGPLVERAVDTYRRLDATRDLLRAEATLRDAGIRHGRRGPRHRPREGWQSLTPTECAVAGLVAEGLTNPQIGRRLFISPRTAQTHVSHVFTKLGLSSRIQLAAEMARRASQPADPPSS